MEIFLFYRRTNCGASIQWNTTQQHKGTINKPITWMDFKCLMLRERKQTQKAICYMILCVWYSGKGKTVVKNRSVTARGLRMGEVWVQSKSELSFFLISSFLLMEDCQHIGSWEKASGLKRSTRLNYRKIRLFLQVNKWRTPSRRGNISPEMRVFLLAVESSLVGNELKQPLFDYCFNLLTF